VPINDWLRRCLSSALGTGYSPVADDCEAYLSGGYIAHLERGGVPVAVPTWAWLNTVSHGRRADIQAVVVDPEALLHRMFFGWRECRSVIAAELLDTTQGDDNLLQRLQADVLQPAETTMFTTAGDTPVTTAQHVLDAIRGYVASIDNGC
jgi:hypothetical protein